MVENSIISIFEGVYSIVLMRKARKTQKMNKWTIFLQPMEKKFHPRLFRIFLSSSCITCQ